jgi:hypothetical protein
MDFLNRSKEVSRSKLEIIISHSIFIQIPQNLYQNSHHNKIYKIMYIKHRIKRIKNVTSWRTVACFARFKALDASNPLQNTWYDVWWWIGSLETCRSSLILNFHIWVLELQPLDSCTNSTNQHLIHTIINSLIMNLQQKTSVMFKKFEFWFEDSFGGRENFGYRNVNCD